MTSTPQPGDQQFNKLEEDDLFLVNKDLDGDGLKYETFSVPYKTIVKDIRGPEGATGSIGATGVPGSQGDPGTSIELKGIVDYYEDLFPIRNGFTSAEEGVVYIVRNDYSPKPSGSYSGTLPGTDECDDPNNPSITSCRRNVAYVFSYSANNYYGQLITEPLPGNFVFIRIGELTGPVGDKGYTSANYDTVRVVEDSDTMYSIAFEDKGYEDDAGNRIDTTKYFDSDLGDFFSDGLPPTDPIGDVRGATGPWFDEITRHGKLIKKDNPDYDTISGATDSWNGSKDEIPYSDDPSSPLPTYEEAYNEAKLAELDPDAGIDYNPQYRYYNHVDIEFTSSNTANPDVASDPHDVLAHFRINDLVGATGANTGSQGPRGEKGDQGDEGLYYDNVVGLYDEPGVTPNNPAPYKSYSLKFTSQNGLPDLHLPQDLMGPAIDESTLIDIINNIEIPDPPAGGDWEGPYVHRGGPGNADINEDIFGQKTICNRLAFRPEGNSDKERMIDFPANMSIYTKQNVNNGQTYLNQIRIYDRKLGGGATNGITLGIRKEGQQPDGSSSNKPAASVGIRCEKPQYALEAKGRTMTGTLVAINNDYFDSGRNLTNFGYAMYGTQAVNWNKLQDYRVGDASSSPLIVMSDLNIKPTNRNGVRLEVGQFNVAAGAYSINCSGQGVWKLGTPNTFRMPSRSDVGYSILGELTKDDALSIVNQIQPKVVEFEGRTVLRFSRDDISDSTLRSKLESGSMDEDHNEETYDIINCISTLALAVQKLSDRLDALEA